MDEARAVNKIEENLPQEKIDFINDVHLKEVQYWKKIALDNKNEDERNQLTNLAPLRISLARKDAIKELKSVNEIIFYLKNKYLHHNGERRTFIEDIPSQEDQFTFEAILDFIKDFSKSIREVENISLKNKTFLGGWISTAAKVFRRKKKKKKKKNICVERICLVDLKIGCIKTAI